MDARAFGSSLTNSKMQRPIGRLTPSTFALGLCPDTPELCARARVETAEWMSGTCKQVYLVLMRALDKAQSK